MGSAIFAVIAIVVVMSFLGVVLWTVVTSLDPEADMLDDPPCERLFERLVDEDPARLVAYLDADLKPTTLTFAAEHAGKISDSSMVVPPLLRLLRHPAAIVREGAVYGIAEHGGEEVTAALLRLAQTDPSPGVRAAAGDALEMRS